MKVAIIGAGISGLACAYELERLGVNPVIFERRFTVGDFHQHTGAMLQISSRPISDQLQYIRDKFDITLLPLNKIEEIVMYSPRNKAVVRGAHLGYTFQRGQDETSMERQLWRFVKSKVNFNTHADYKVLAKEFDYVVVASGNHMISNDVGIWREAIVAFIKGAVILGDFNPRSMSIWVDTDFAKSGYGYMIPFDDKKATLGLVVPYATKKEMENYWNLFLKTIKLNNPIVETFEQDLTVGYCTTHVVDNMYFVGNAAGLLDPLLGYGIFAGLLSGIYAAIAIVQKKDYEKMIKPLVRTIDAFTAFRNYIDELDNKGIDRLIKFLKVPGIKHMIYNTNINVLQLGARLLRK